MREAEAVPGRADTIEQIDVTPTRAGILDALIADRSGVSALAFMDDLASRLAILGER